jgi:small-conductance mechanosensitive channel
VVTLLLLVPIFYVATWAGNSTRHVLEQGVLDRLSLDASRKFSIVSLSRYGVMIILSRPIKEGDRVQIAGLEGDVKQIRVLYSVVNTLTDETLIIPNREIVENIVHNQSYDQPSIILFTDVQVSYRSDLDKVKEVLTRVGEESSFLHEGKRPRVLFRSFDDSGITVTLAVPIRSAIERHIATSDIMLDIWRAFRSTGIEIPFPQMDLYVKQIPPAPEAGELT